MVVVGGGGWWWWLVVVVVCKPILVFNLALTKLNDDKERDQIGGWSKSPPS